MLMRLQRRRQCLRRRVLRETSGSSRCEWKGQPSYYDLVTDTRVAPRAAWSYLNPSAGFEPIRRGRGDGRSDIGRGGTSVVMAGRTFLPASDVDRRGIHHWRLGVGAAT